MNTEVELSRIASFLGPTSNTELKWRWNIENDDFEMDFRALEKLLATQKTIGDFNDFYSLLSSTGQSALLTYIEAYMRGSSAHPIKLDIVNEHDKKMSFALKVEKKNRSIFEGSLCFAADIPKRSEVVSVLAQIFNNHHHGMVITDHETKVLTCNSYFEQCSGYKLSELVGKKTSIFNAHKHGDVFFTEMWSNIHYYGYWSGMILSRRKGGAIEPQELTIQEIHFADKLYYLGVTRDLSKSLYRLEGEEYGGIELLTQLPSKKEFLRQLEAVQLSLDDHQSMLVMVIKLNTQESNGDTEVTQELSSALSMGGTNQITGFLGSGIFCCGITFNTVEKGQNLSTVYKVIRGLIAQLRQRMSSTSYKELTQSTIGVSVLGEDTDNILKMLPNALKAMYERHTNASNHVCFYNSSMHHKFKRREKLEKVIRSVISTKRVEVNYQPIFDTRDWSIHYFEALCRFRGASGAVLNTKEVIDIATDLGLVQELDLIVAQAAIHDRETLANLHESDIGVSINVSLNSQHSARTVLGRLVQLARSHVEDAKHLNVELSDYVDLEDPYNSRLIDELVSLRVSLSLDDFLTGQSVFSHIRDGRFEYLKIERQFVEGLTKGSGNYSILQAIVALAHKMDLKVIAKGVETISELDALYRLGVDYMQGFYFSKPEALQDIKPYSGYKRQLEEIQSVCESKGVSSIVTKAYQLKPNDSLEEIKNIFDSSPFTVLPVTNEKKCVGYIDQQSYKLHLSPTLGTDIETMHDLKLLKKRAHQIMNPNVIVVSRDISKEDMARYIERDLLPPWIVVDSNGYYVGVLESEQVMRYLVRED